MDCPHSPHLLHISLVGLGWGCSMDNPRRPSRSKYPLPISLEDERLDQNMGTHEKDDQNPIRLRLFNQMYFRLSEP